MGSCRCREDVAMQRLCREGAEIGWEGDESGAAAIVQEERQWPGVGS